MGYLWETVQFSRFFFRLRLKIQKIRLLYKMVYLRAGVAKWQTH